MLTLFCCRHRLLCLFLTLVFIAALTIVPQNNAIIKLPVSGQEWAFVNLHKNSTNTTSTPKTRHASLTKSQQIHISQQSGSNTNSTETKTRKDTKSVSSASGLNNLQAGNQDRVDPKRNETVPDPGKKIIQIEVWHRNDKAGSSTKGLRTRLDGSPHGPTDKGQRLRELMEDRARTMRVNMNDVCKQSLLLWRDEGHKLSPN